MNEEKHLIRLYQCTLDEYKEHVLNQHSEDDDKESSSDKNINQTKEKSQ